MTLTFIKLGGSLITDKREAQSFRADLMRQAAEEIASARAADPTLGLVVGHGSGSFGHVAAQKHGTMQGVHTPDQWRGFAEVAYVARRLNSLVLDTLFEAGLPVMSMQPSASAMSTDGALIQMETASIRTLLERGLIPLVFGDVSLDSVRGGTIISTETVFGYLASKLHPTRIFLLGEVEGVYDSAGVVFPHIHPGNFDQIAAALGGSRGTDVTGGMSSKVRGMLDLAASVEGLQVRIFGGTTPGQLRSALLGESTPGTLLTAHA
ncbi:MAG: isopentenyl phosphate kinase family protein [Anaerolineae bacterium]|nr:isopentenyl phosphate kinase family protein [Anaerolineae bacterium]